MTEKTVSRQQWRYMGYNLFTFTLLFGLFGLIVFAQLRQSLFTQMDEELMRSRQMILEAPEYVEQQKGYRLDRDDQFQQGSQPGEQPPDLPKEHMPKEDEPGPEPPGDEEIPIWRKRAVMLSMRVQPLVRKEDGTCINTQSLGRLFWDDFLDEIPFEADKLDQITSFRLSDGSNMRSLLFIHADQDGTEHYVQLLVNVDAEQGILDEFVRIIALFIIIFVFLAICGSYFLSKKTMMPLIRSWRRQTEFVEDASHELRTPLTIIQNKLESLLTTPQARIIEKADSIAVSLSETRRLSKLTSDLMTLARADSAQTLLEKARFDLDELVRSISDAFVELAGLEDKTLTVDLQYGEQLDADKNRIHELLVVLLDNALKYTRPGDSIEVRTELRDNRAVIQVRDTGIGISEEGRARIFDRFYREDKARSRKHGGTGLGLSIAKWIVDSHSGTVKAYPNGSKGTVFEVRIPRG